MSQLFMTGTRPSRFRRTWEDSGFGGIREAEGREGQAQRDSDSRDRAERGGGSDSGGGNQGHDAMDSASRSYEAMGRSYQAGAGQYDGSRASAGLADPGKRGSGWGGKILKGLGKVARVGAAVYTGGLSETAISLGKTVKGAVGGWSSGRGSSINRGGTNQGPGNHKANTREGNDHGGQDQRRTSGQVVSVGLRRPGNAATTQAQLVRARAYARDRRTGTTATYRPAVLPIYRSRAVQETPIQFQIRSRSWGGGTLGGLDDEELAGLGKTLKKIGKKIGNAFKGKNLLKTAAIAATAYGGYKLVTSGTGKSIASSIGSGLSKVGETAAKVGSAVAQAAPQLANSFIAYKQAETVYPGATVDADASLPLGTYLADGTYIPSVYETGESATSTTQTLPSWVLPAAIGAGVLLLVSRR